MRGTRRPAAAIGGAAMLAALAWGSVARAQDAAAPGDVAAGEHVFVKCRACHQIGEHAHNSIGPELNGVIGRHSGAVPDYNYSDANRNSGLTWDPATFKRYIRDPRGVVPGTKMTFAGLTKQSDIDNVLAYLESFGPDGKRK